MKSWRMCERINLDFYCQNPSLILYAHKTCERLNRRLANVTILFKLLLPRPVDSNRIQDLGQEDKSLMVKHKSLKTVNEYALFSVVLYFQKKDCMQLL